jgi:DNA repair exonuclease SbcCD ATPase subunit
MIKELGKKVFKEIKKLMEKLEKKKKCLDRQEDLLILEKKRNLALEKALPEEKVKVKNLSIALSLANDSKERMSKETTLINESLASLKATHSELQESFSCLTTKYKGLEVSYKAPKPILKQLLTPISSQVKGAQNVIKLMHKLVLLTWLS